MLQDRATRASQTPSLYLLPLLPQPPPKTESLHSKYKLQVQIQIHYNTTCICVMMTGLPKYGHGGHFMPHLLGTIITCPYLDTGRGKSISEDYHFLLHHVSSSLLSSSSWWSSERGTRTNRSNQFSTAGFTALVCVHKRRREGNNRWCCRNIKPTTQIIINCCIGGTTLHAYIIT